MNFQHLNTNISKKIRNTRILIRIILFCFKEKRYDKIEKFLKDYQNPKILKLNTFGQENLGSIIYHISEQGQGYGYFAEFKCMLEKLIFADNIGLIPYISFGNDFVYYDESINTTKNAFEYYFEPLIKIENIKSTSNVTMANQEQLKYIEQLYNVTGYEISEEFELKLAEMFRKYIKIKPSIQNKLDESLKDKLINNTLGIHYRGTDFKKGYNKHPIAIDLEELITETKRIINKFEYKNIFFATDDINAVNLFKKEFGNMIIIFEDVYRGDTMTSVAFSNSDRTNHKYQLGYEVIRDVYALSKCGGLISGLSQVSLGARIFKRSRNEEYSFVRIINKGINKNLDSFSKI